MASNARHLRQLRHPETEPVLALCIRSLGVPRINHRLLGLPFASNLGHRLRHDCWLVLLASDVSSRSTVDPVSAAIRNRIGNDDPHLRSTRGDPRGQSGDARRVQSDLRAPVLRDCSARSVASDVAGVDAGTRGDALFRHPSHGIANDDQPPLTRGSNKPAGDNLDDGLAGTPADGAAVPRHAFPIAAGRVRLASPGDEYRQAGWVPGCPRGLVRANRVAGDSILAQHLRSGRPTGRRLRTEPVRHVAPRHQSGVPTALARPTDLRPAGGAGGTGRQLVALGLGQLSDSSIRIITRLVAAEHRAVAGGRSHQ